jgi:hypothetical protein
MGLEQDTKKAKKTIINTPTFEQLPDEKATEFKAIVSTIIDKYQLTHPIDIAMAKRAAKQFWYMEYCDAQIKKYGLFLEYEDDNGNLCCKMNPLSYSIKQFESEFRAYIRLLDQKNKGGGNQAPGDFLEFIKEGGKRKK